VQVTAPGGPDRVRITRRVITLTTGPPTGPTGPTEVVSTRSTRQTRPTRRIESPAG